jgi:hypothetical protein
MRWVAGNPSARPEGGYLARQTLDHMPSKRAVLTLRLGPSSGASRDYEDSIFRKKCCKRYAFPLSPCEATLNEFEPAL